MSNSVKEGHSAEEALDEADESEEKLREGEDGADVEPTLSPSNSAVPKLGVAEDQGGSVQTRPTLEPVEFEEQEGLAKREARSPGSNACFHGPHRQMSASAPAIAAILPIEVLSVTCAAIMDSNRLLSSTAVWAAPSR